MLYKKYNQSENRPLIAFGQVYLNYMIRGKLHDFFP